MEVKGLWVVTSGRFALSFGTAETDDIALGEGTERYLRHCRNG